MLFPEQRRWPPQVYSFGAALPVWAATIMVAGPAIWLAVSGWGHTPLPGWVRYGLALPAFIVANFVVWSAVVRFGFDKTSGASGKLVTSGLYRYSRNPQYVADILMLLSWGLLSASHSVWSVIGIGIVTLLLAPFAEEKWLQEAHGEQFTDYSRRTPRFLGMPVKRSK